MSIHMLLVALQAPRPRGFGALFETTGTFGPLMALLGAVALYLALRRWLELRPGTLAPEPLQRSLEASLRAGRSAEGLSQAEASRSVLGEIVASGLQMHPSGLDEMLSGVERGAIKVSLRYSNRIANLGRLGVVILLLGVLGTVLALMSTMQVIEILKDPGLQDWTRGIIEALACTAFGLAFGIGCFAAHFVLENRLARRSLAVREIAEELVRAAARPKGA